MRSKYIAIVILVCLQLWFAVARASIVVSPMLINFVQNGSHSARIGVKNTGLTTEYIQVRSYKIRVSHHKELKKRIINPADGLLVFPSHLTLAPGQTDYVRVVRTQANGAKDQNYMVTVTPVISGLEVKKMLGKKLVGLHLILGYGVRVIVRPKELKMHLVFQKKDGYLKIYNHGNTSIVLANMHEKGSKKRLRSSCGRDYAGSMCRVKLVNKNQKVVINTLLMDRPYKQYNL